MSSVAIRSDRPERSRLAAGLLSLIAPGAGHVYIGRARRGLVLLGVLIAIQPLLLAIGFALPPQTFVMWAYGLGLLLALIAFLLFIVVDAIRLTRRAENTPARWRGIVATILVAWIALA